MHDVPGQVPALRTLRLGNHIQKFMLRRFQPSLVFMFVHAALIFYAAEIPTNPNVLVRLDPVLIDQQPLHVRHGVRPARAQRLHMVNLPSWTGSRAQAGAGTWVMQLKD